MLAITKDTGQFYNMLLKTSRAKKVLEVGTSTGYSTLWFADALMTNHGKDCQIVTIENDSAKIKRCMKNFTRVGVDDIVTVVQDDAPNALKTIKDNLDYKFDFAFIDADKENMVEYFDLILPMMRKGGIIAADNILLPKRYARFAKRYVNHVRAMPSVDSVTVNIGKGEELSIKNR